MCKCSFLLSLPSFAASSQPAELWGAFTTATVMQIKAIPEDMEYNGKGPLLSARLPDLDLVWQRAAQILEICKEVWPFVHSCLSMATREHASIFSELLA